MGTWARRHVGAGSTSHRSNPYIVDGLYSCYGTLINGPQGWESEGAALVGG